LGPEHPAQAIPRRFVGFTDGHVGMAVHLQVDETGSDRVVVSWSSQGSDRLDPAIGESDFVVSEHPTRGD